VVSSLESAVIVVQRHYRENQAKKEFLSGNLFSKYQVLSEQINSGRFQGIPRSSTGKTAVYFPIEMPKIILKKSGRKDAVERFHQAQDVRTILKSQNSFCLIIPNSRPCGEFLIEDRLPINVDSYHNIRVYSEEPRLFDNAVREMTRLFSQRFLTDLITFGKSPLGHMKGCGGYIRYDNLPLYITEENGKREGKIGLIDLEHMQKISDCTDLNKFHLEALKTLVKIFPLHLEIIQQEAVECNIEVENEILETVCESGKKYLDLAYSSYANWLTERSFLNKDSFEITQIRQEELASVVKKELLKLNQGDNDLFERANCDGIASKNFFTGDVEIKSKEFSTEIARLIIEEISDFIKGSQEKWPCDVTSISDVISLRSLQVRREKIHDEKVSDYIYLQREKGEIENLSPVLYFGNQFEENLIAEQLVYVVMKELIKGGELFHFDPGYYRAGNDHCWIRY
jgi:hypothetical protein